jgi:hypothetical protein
MLDRLDLRNSRDAKPLPNPFAPDEDEIALFAPNEDPLGDFGLDDEESQPEPGDFWIESDGEDD